MLWVGDAIIKDESKESRIALKPPNWQVRMDNLEERYIHFANCIDSLNQAWRILKKIRDGKDNPLRGFAFQFALIEYSKPYKASYGIKIKHHKLSEAFVPEDHLELHKRIILARDKILAHLDLNIIDAKVYVQSTEHGRNILRSQNIIDGTVEMKNIDNIIILIEGTLDTIYKEVQKLGDDLNPNI